MVKSASTRHLDAERAESAAIVASSHDAIVGITRSGSITSCNPAAVLMYGASAREMIGQAAEALIPVERRADEAAVLRRIVAGEEVDLYRTERLRHDGSVVPVWASVSPILDASGMVVGVAVAARKIGASEQAHDRFEIRVDQQRAEAKDAAERLERRSEVDTANERTGAQQDKDHLQGQLQQSQRLEVLGQLAGGVAHDFNNLLAVILNYAAFVVEELAAGPEGDLTAAGRDVAQIQRAAERATALTHQLLAFARREVVQPRVLDLNDVVTEVQQLLERTIGTDVVLHTDLAADLWPVLADAGQIEQILVNLAVNARDAMIDGGVLSIDTANIVVGAEFITAESLVRAGNHVRLRIGDTGTGMAPDVVAHVFEPFFTTKADGTGTGLGLATVYGIVIQAEATIEIHSQAGVGTTFTILIPVTDEIAIPIEEETPYQRTPTGETVLIVEDEEALREVTQRIFTRNGYRVLTAADGAEALAAAAAYDGEIHLLVTDVVMPNMLGKEVVERMLLIKPNIEVLYMSGYARPVLAAQGRLGPDVHLIEKPFSSATLIAKAGQILNGHFAGFHTVEVTQEPPTGG